MTIKGRHFRVEKWADYVRGAATHTDRESMEEHLRSGCADCTSASKMLSEVAAVARRAACTGEVPARAVRRAKSVLPTVEKGSFFPTLVGELVFDSWLQPLPAGVRSGSRESRQAIYRVGEYYVYIRVEKQLESQLLSLVGQVANETLPQQPMKSVAVALRCGEETLIQSVSNEHGEFQFEYEPKRRLHLWVGLTDRNIDVPLSRFSTWKG